MAETIVEGLETEWTYILFLPVIALISVLTGE